MSAAVTKPIISIVGGTQPGIRVLTQILKHHDILNKVEVKLFEPQSFVSYTELFPYMATGHISSSRIQQSLTDVLPKDVRFITSLPSEIDTKNQVLLTDSGEKHHYDYLILSLNSQEDYKSVEGLKEALEDPSIPVTSSSNFESSGKHLEQLKFFKGGKIQFYVPKGDRSALLDNLSTINLSLEYLKNKYLNFNLLFQTDIVAQEELPSKAITEYEALGALSQFYKTLQVNEHEGLTLREINSKKLTAIYEDKSTRKTKSLPFDLLHANSNKILPELLRKLPTLNQQFVDINKKTLKVKGFENIWALGYCADLGSLNFSNFSKQAEVVSNNLLNLAVHKGKHLEKEYAEHSEQPLYLGKQKIIDSNSESELDNLKASLKYYNHIYIDPLLYKVSI